MKRTVIENEGAYRVFIALFVSSSKKIEIKKTTDYFKRQYLGWNNTQIALDSKMEARHGKTGPVFETVATSERSDSLAGYN